MSIALEARVAELEARVVGQQGQIDFLRGVLKETNDRIASIEAARKPGPKPKDAQ